MEKTGYILLAIVAAVWITVVLAGLIMVWPYGLLGLIGISGIGFLLIKVISDRLHNKEDDYYADNVDK
jgi:pilus assembly protein TadC